MPEKITSVDYFITFTLKPHQHKEDVDDQRSKGIKLIEGFYELLEASGLLVFELTKSMNVHFHSLVKFHTTESVLKRIKFHIHDYFRKSKVIGFIDFQQATDYNKVLMYLLYDYDETKLFTDLNPICWNYKQEHQEIGQVEFFGYKPYITKDELDALLIKMRKLKEESSSKGGREERMTHRTACPPVVKLPKGAV